MIGIGLIKFAIRRVKPPLSEKQMGLSLAAGFLLLLGDFLIIYAFAEENRVGGLIFALLCIGSGFALIWYAQRSRRPAAAVSEAPIHAFEPLQGGETSVTGDTISGEIALPRRAPIEVDKSPEVHKRRWVIGAAIAGGVSCVESWYSV